ncbi:hypothetical protein A7G45_17785 [Mycolicibacterium llatzerense]|nr:hypothetical protein [Mycolicibacterium llatzerense]
MIPTGPLSFALATSDCAAEVLVPPPPPPLLSPLFLVHDTATVAVSAITATNDTAPMAHFAAPLFFGGTGAGHGCCGPHCPPGPG